MPLPSARHDKDADKVPQLRTCEAKTDQVCGSVFGLRGASLTRRDRAFDRL